MRSMIWVGDGVKEPLVVSAQTSVREPSNTSESGYIGAGWPMPYYAGPDRKRV